MYTRGPSTQVADTRTQWGVGRSPLPSRRESKHNQNKVLHFFLPAQGLSEGQGAARPPARGVGREGTSWRGRRDRSAASWASVCEVPGDGRGWVGPAGWAVRAAGLLGGRPPGAWQHLGERSPAGRGPWSSSRGGTGLGSLEWPSGLPAGGLPRLCGPRAHGKGPDNGGDPAMAARPAEAHSPPGRRPGWTGGAGLGSEQRIRAGQLAPSTSAPVHQPPQPPARALATCWAGRVLSQRVVLCVDI